jgi:DNA excision repair protein ERCC-1
LTSIRSINKSDVATLSKNFKSFKNIVRSSHEQLSICNGLGEKKIKRLNTTFHTSFKRNINNSNKIEQYLN